MKSFPISSFRKEILSYFYYEYRNFSFFTAKIFARWRILLGLYIIWIGGKVFLNFRHYVWMDWIEVDRSWAAFYTHGYPSLNGISEHIYLDNPAYERHARWHFDVILPFQSNIGRWALSRTIILITGMKIKKVFHCRKSNFISFKRSRIFGFKWVIEIQLQFHWYQ